MASRGRRCRASTITTSTATRERERVGVVRFQERIFAKREKHIREDLIEMNNDQEASESIIMNNDQDANESIKMDNDQDASESSRQKVEQRYGDTIRFCETTETITEVKELVNPSDRDNVEIALLSFRMDEVRKEREQRERREQERIRHPPVMWLRFQDDEPRFFVDFLDVLKRTDIDRR